MCEVKGGCTCGNEACQSDYDDYVIVDRIKDAPEHKIFNIDVGNLPEEKAKTAIAGVMNHNDGLDEK